MHHNAELLYRELLSDLEQVETIGPYKPDHDASKTGTAIAGLRASFLKKFHNDAKNTDGDRSALDKFLNCNERCASYALPSELSIQDRMLIGEMKSVLHDFFHPSPLVKRRICLRALQRPVSQHRYVNTVCRSLESAFDDRLLTLSSIARWLGWGSGANIGSPSDSYYSKLVDSSMATTNPELYQLFRLAIHDDVLWDQIETERSHRYGVQVVVGSKLSFVPKTREISRVICTEPTLNMLIQKSVGIVIERHLDEVFKISLSTQPDFNRLMARVGSLTGEYGTIDLQSASDSISLGLVRMLLPPSVVSWLERSRSPFTQLPDGTKVELAMISSMGNGYTFPLQTLIFTAAVLAVYKVMGIKTRYNTVRHHGNFGVFGDDIIVKQGAYDRVCSLLSLLGFVVNQDKSFNTGLFRESCGHDYYHGYNVRGVYLKTLHDDADLYSVFNRLGRWSAAHQIPLPRVLRLILSMLRRKNYVPYDESDDAGLKVPYEHTTGIRKNENGSWTYYAAVRVPNIVRLPKTWPLRNKKDIKTYNRALKQLRRFTYSPDGLLQSKLAGYIRAGTLTLRTSGRRIVLKKRVSPGWERHCSAGTPQDGGPLDIRAWKVLMSINLEG